jgi:hypothetical protein
MRHFNSARETGSKRHKGKLAVPCISGVAALAVVLLFASVCIAGIRWSPGGVPISSAASLNETVPQLTSDGSGGAVVTWQREESSGGLISDIYAARVNPAGSPLWGPTLIAGTVTIDERNPAIASDDAGGAVITWERRESPGSDYDIYAARVTSAGTIGWGPIPVSNPPNIYEYSSQVIPDGGNGAVITWCREESTGTYDYDIYAARVNASGGFVWGPTAISAVPNITEIWPRLVSDGASGAVITWSREESTESFIYDIFAARVNASGGFVWGPAAISAAPTISETRPRLATDGSSGAVLSWNTEESTGTNIFDIYAARMSSAGGLLWGPIPVSNTPNIGELDNNITSDGASGAVITWSREESTGTFIYDIYAARVSSAGGLLWGPTPVSNPPNIKEYFPSITSDGASGAVITWWQEESTGSSIFDVYAARVNSTGAIPWGPTAIGNTPNLQEVSPQSTTDMTGGAIIAWQRDQSPGVLSYDIYAQRMSNPAPTVTGLTPGTGLNTGAVSITDLSGTWFSDIGDVPDVRLKMAGQADIAATGVAVASSTQITCNFNITGAATGAWDVAVNNPDGQTGTLAGGFTVTEPQPPPPPPPPTTPTWYLAEGTSAWGFTTYITIENPNNEACTAGITYNTETGPKTAPDVALPPMSQTTVNPEQVVPDQDFSTLVTCKEGKTIAVDRTMSWTGTGAPSPEGHSSTGVTSPYTTWYLPEGSSEWGFECWLLIQNPNNAEATCTVTYMTEHHGAIPVEHKVPPNSRKTFNMEEDIGKKDASIKVDSDLPVIPERAMYRNNRREGHDSIGTTASATDYYLAEGTTAWGFTTYVLVQNPNNSPTDVTITYMTPSGPRATPTFQMVANSRNTIRVSEIPEVGNTDLSTAVHGSQPIIAERAMYWGEGTALGEACHDSIGMAQPHTTFYLPDGETYNLETWTLVQNPNGSDVQVEISYLTPSGTGNVVFTDTVPGNSRKSYNMSDRIPAGRAAIMVTSKTSGKKIMVERAMYWNNRGAGTDTVGGYSD